MTTSRSPRRVLRVAYDAARQALPAHRHELGAEKFTQRRLLACLVLKEPSRLDHRGPAGHLADDPDPDRVIELEVVPHSTTFREAAGRPLVAKPGRATFDAVLAIATRREARKRRVPLAAVDGTGPESRHVGRYHVKPRAEGGAGTRETAYSKHPEVVLVTDRHSHMALAAAPGRGPGSDLVRFEAALKGAAGLARIGTPLADADYDAEWVHEHVREESGIRTIIPAERGRPSERPPAGKWRRMRRRLDKVECGRRWRTEAVNSMIKRRLGSAPRARGYWARRREIILIFITHDVMIVARIRVFYRALRVPHRGRREVHRRQGEGQEAGKPTRRSARAAPSPVP